MLWPTTFQNDFDTAADHQEGRRADLRRPSGLCAGTSWCGTSPRRGVRTRMAVVNPEAYPPKSLKEKKMAAGGDRYQTPDSVLAGWTGRDAGGGGADL